MRAVALAILFTIGTCKWCSRGKDLCHGNQHNFTTIAPFENFSNPKIPRRTELIRFEDLDSDGHLDAVAFLSGNFDGGSAWQLLFYRKGPEHLAEGKPLEVLPLERMSTTVRSVEFTDWDGDGDLDFMITERGEDVRNCTGTSFFFRFFEQVRDGATISFVEIQAPAAFGFLTSECWDSHVVVQVVDLNQNGQKDLLLSRPYKSIGIRYFQNQSGQLQEVEKHPLSGLEAAICTHGKMGPMWVADWDGDGDLDVVAICSCCCTACACPLVYAEQLDDGSFLGVLEADGWMKTIGWEGRPNWEPAWAAYDGCDPGSLQVIDWNKDGLSDLFLDRYIQVQTRVPGFVARKGDQNPFGGLGISDGEPQFVDWDMDGRIDLLLAGDTQLRYFKRVHGDLMEQNLDVALVPLIWNGHKTGVHAVDWNGDGDSDLVVVSYDGQVKVFDNDGGKLSELNASQHFIGSSLPVSFTDDDSPSFPLRVQLFDWDQDGDLDLLLGPWRVKNSDFVGAAFFEQVEGKLLRRENHSLARVPRLDIEGEFSWPELSWQILDCDGDGDLDLIRFTGSCVRSGCKPLVTSCRQEDRELHCAVPTSRPFWAPSFDTGPCFDTYINMDYGAQAGGSSQHFVGLDCPWGE